MLDEVHDQVVHLALLERQVQFGNEIKFSKSEHAYDLVLPGPGVFLFFNCQLFAVDGD